MAAKDKMQTILSKETPITQKVLDNWVPIAGCVGYEIYSLNIMHPYKFSKLFGSLSPRVEDATWAAAGIGLGVYIYQQKCLQRAPHPWRIAYSCAGSTIFNLGSNLLMLVTSQGLLRKAPGMLKMLLGLSAGSGLLYIGWHYMTYLNSITPDSDTDSERPTS